MARALCDSFDMVCCVRFTATFDQGRNLSRATLGGTNWPASLEEAAPVAVVTCEEMPVEDRFLLVDDIGDAQVGTSGRKEEKESRTAED